jgi:hypothetical protein
MNMNKKDPKKPQYSERLQQLTRCDWAEGRAERAGTEETNVDLALKPGRGQKGDRRVIIGTLNWELSLTRLRSRLVLRARRGAGECWVQPEDD